MNRRIGTARKLVCVSRPHRFGKSYDAHMLCAYYDHTCDSHTLYDDCAISHTAEYEKYLNSFNVLFLDIDEVISGLISQRKPLSQTVPFILDTVRGELVREYPELENLHDTYTCMEAYVEKSKRKFLFIIDGWDALMRLARDDTETQIEYLAFLHTLFKNGNFTQYVVAAAYMTGILPIKKDGSQSALSNFREYTVLNPDELAEFMGFTETEVQNMCAVHHMKFSDLREWYDGYYFGEYGPVYNPYAVMAALESGKCQSYWRKTSSEESLISYINMDFDGLQEIVTRLITGEKIPVNVDFFANDLTHFTTRDDVLTLLIHLGYLTYNIDKTVRIPNEDIRTEFRQILSVDTP